LLCETYVSDVASIRNTNSTGFNIYRDFSLSGFNKSYI
jgi:hypothetical protein